MAKKYKKGVEIERRLFSSLHRARQYPINENLIADWWFRGMMSRRETSIGVRVQVVNWKRARGTRGPAAIPTWKGHARFRRAGGTGMLKSFLVAASEINSGNYF